MLVTAKVNFRNHELFCEVKAASLLSKHKELPGWYYLLEALESESSLVSLLAHESTLIPAEERALEILGAEDF